MEGEPRSCAIDDIGRFLHYRACVFSSRSLSIVSPARHLPMIDRRWVGIWSTTSWCKTSASMFPAKYCRAAAPWKGQRNVRTIAICESGSDCLIISMIGQILRSERAYRQGTSGEIVSNQDQSSWDCCSADFRLREQSACLRPIRSGRWRSNRCIFARLSCHRIDRRRRWRLTILLRAPMQRRRAGASHRRFLDRC